MLVWTVSAVQADCHLLFSVSKKKKKTFMSSIAPFVTRILWLLWRQFAVVVATGPVRIAYQEERMIIIPLEFLILQMSCSWCC